jgi:TolB-like protein
MGLIAELKRRNVFRVAIAYGIIAWVLAQVADLAFDGFDAPAWVLKSVLVILALGFPLAVFFAWAFELTPEGVKKQAEVDRSQSITQNTGRKLNYLIIAVLAVAVGLLLVDKFVKRETPATEVPVAVTTTDKSLAVLPFVAMSNGPDDEYFADGLTEEILNSLAQLPELLVTARTSAFSFKGLDVPIPEIAAKLGVAHVVEGSVRRSGDQMRITAQLIRANDGFHLWSDTYDRSSADSFGVQGEIAEKVASALDVVLDDTQREQMLSSGLRNPEAFIAFQKGIEIYDRAHATTVDEQIRQLALANSQFEKALALEPNAATVWFAHADYYIHYAVDADATTSDAERAAADDAIYSAESDLQNAIRYASGDGGRLSATLEYALIAREWRRLPELFRAAVQSTDCMSPSWWGVIVPLIEPLDGGLAVWQRARACDPLNFSNWANMASMQSTMGDFAAAIATAEEGIKMVPHRQIVDGLIYGLIGAGEFDKALAANERLVEDANLRKFRRMRIEAARGDSETLRELRDELAKEAGADNFEVTTLAHLGERDRANQAAAAVDARPLGFLDLADMADSCKCGAPFDLEFTPNFARLVDEAQLMWPPRSSIEWPLKVW